MESRQWIKLAGELIEKLNSEAANNTLRNEETQKEVTAMFKVLDNPTLPSAYRLRDAAHYSGYTISPSVLQRLTQHEFLV